MANCVSCHLQRSPLDNHDECLACKGCTSDNPCRTCTSWSEDKWSACLAFYQERKDESEEEDKSSSHSKDPPNLPKETDPVKLAAEMVTADGEGAKGESDRSGSRSPRYVRTDRERVPSTVRVVTEKRRRTDDKSPRKSSSKSRRHSRERSPSPHRYRSYERRERREDRERTTPYRDYDRDRRYAAFDDGRYRSDDYRPRRHVAARHNNWLFDHRAQARYMEEYDGGQAAYEEMYGPQEDPYGQWGDYENYYVTDEPPTQEVAAPSFDPPPQRQVYVEQVEEPQEDVAPPPQRVIRKRKRSRAKQESDQPPSDDEEEEDEDDKDDDTSSSSSSSSSSDDEGSQLTGKAKHFREAVKRIRNLLPSARVAPPKNASRYVAASLEDQDRLRKKGKPLILPQPPNLAKVVDALNDHLDSIKKKETVGPPKETFLSASAWPPGMGITFKLGWYAGPVKQYYSCPKPTTTTEFATFAGGPGEASQHIPDVLEKTATLSRNAVAVAGFMELASRAISKAVKSKKTPKKKLKDIRAISKVVTRAAHHAAGNSICAATNMDLWRRDIMLKNCPNLSNMCRNWLRHSSIGTKNFFYESTSKYILKNYPEAKHDPKEEKNQNVGGYYTGYSKNNRGGKSGRPFRPGRGGRGQTPRQNHQAPDAASATDQAARGHDYRGRRPFRARGRGRRPRWQ